MSKTYEFEHYKNALQKVDKHLDAVLPTSCRQQLNPQRISNIMLNALWKNDKLRQCTPISIVKFCLTAASLGLEPHGTLQHLWCVSFYNTKIKSFEATPIIGYKGLLHLALRSAGVKSVHTQVIYLNDHYKIDLGTSPKIEHSPTPADRGRMLYVYCVAILANGNQHIEIMTKKDVDKVRESSKSKDSAAWVDWYDEMARKTVVRRASKYWPLTTEMSDAMDWEDNNNTSNILDSTIIDAIEPLIQEEPTKQAEKLAEKLK